MEQGENSAETAASFLVMPSLPSAPFLRSQKWMSPGRLPKPHSAR
jgi:hypothetical protein